MAGRSRATGWEGESGGPALPARFRNLTKAVLVGICEGPVRQSVQVGPTRNLPSVPDLEGADAREEEQENMPPWARLS